MKNFKLMSIILIGLPLVGCSTVSKCVVPECNGHRGYWEMNHQEVAESIKSGNVRTSVSAWLKARESVTPTVKGWQNDDLHIKYYMDQYQIKDQRKSGWEDNCIFLTEDQIKNRLKK